MMQAAYNSYVLRVLEQMTSEGIPLASAKRKCKQNLQFLEQSYLNLADTTMVARELLEP